MSRTNLKLIGVSEKNYESLKKFGNFQETFDDVITKILDKIDTLPDSRREEPVLPGIFAGACRSFCP